MIRLFKATSVIAISSLISLEMAYAACFTSQPDCSGLATLKNTSQATRCVSIYWENGGIRNFCLRAGEEEYGIQVRTGDRYCWSDGDYKPREDLCTKKYFKAVS